MDAEALANLIDTVLPGLERRRLVFVGPTPRPPPPGAWAPGVLSAQFPLAGRIHLAAPDGAGERWTTIDHRHLLLVCPGGWSPRRADTARRHLALSVGHAIDLRLYETPAGGPGRASLRASCDASDPALEAVCTAAVTCAARAPRAQVLRPLLLALVPLLAPALRRAPEAGPTAAIRAELRAHCHQDLQRDAVAARFGIGGDHLTRLLRADGGEGFLALIHRYRLERARELLRAGDLGVAEIAQRCGFGGATWFIRCFRRAHGTTPGAWRRAWRGASGAAG